MKYVEYAALFGVVGVITGIFYIILSVKFHELRAEAKGKESILLKADSMEGLANICGTIAGICFIISFLCAFMGPC